LGTAAAEEGPHGREKEKKRGGKEKAVAKCWELVGFPQCSEEEEKRLSRLVVVANMPLERKKGGKEKGERGEKRMGSMMGDSHTHAS